MLAGKRAVILRVPVLRQHGIVKACGQLVDDGHDRVAVGHCQGSTRAEVILHIDHQQDAALCIGMG